MATDIKKSFYFFGASEFQDLLPPLLESLRNGDSCWVCFFNILDKKNQFYYYSKEELFSFIEEICIKNKLPIPLMSYYEKEDEDKFKKEYSDIRPYFVFIQGIFHKYISWYPVVNLSKLIHFSWCLDGVKNFKHSPYNNIILNVARYEEDLEPFLKLHAPAVYFGSWAEEHLSYNFVGNIALPNLNSKKICFMTGTWQSDSSRPKLQEGSSEHPNAREGKLARVGLWNKQKGKLIDDVIDFLHDNNFYIIFKRREKGFPFNKVLGFSNYTSRKFDFVIDKDLYLPSSLFYFPTISDLCLTIGDNTQGERQLCNFFKKVCPNVAQYQYHKNAFNDISNFVLNEAEFISKKKKLPSKPKTRPSEMLINYINDRHLI